MNGRRIVIVALVALLVFPAVTAGYSNGAVTTTPIPTTTTTTDTPQNGFSAVANERPPGHVSPIQSVYRLHEQSAVGPTGVIAQQSGPAANGSNTTAGGTVSPDADFEITNVDSDLRSGEQGSIEVTIENQGEDARNAVVTLQSLSGTLLFGESTTESGFVGDWDEGDRETIEVDATALASADARSYPVQATVSYEDDDGNQSQSAPLTFGVTPGEQADDFEIVSTSSDVWVGGTGNLTAVLENQGGDTEDAVVTLGTLSGDIVFGGAANTSQFVGDWDAGDRKTIEVEVSAAPTATERDYPVQATVTYDDGQRTQSVPYVFAITPDGEQAFTLGDVDSSLSVGESDSISGTVTNEGPKPVRDATLVFAANASDVTPRQSDVLLGSLEPGESIDFEYPFAVNETTEPGDRQLPFVVQYQNAEGETLLSNQLNTEVTIDERTDDFELSGVESNVQVGDTGTVALTIRNTGSVAREAVSVTLESTNGQVLFGNSTSATRFVGAWESNETKTIAFRTTVTPDASVESYALDARVNYRNDDGQPVTSQQLSVGISPRAEQTFAINDTNTTLRIDRDGHINGTVTNTGPLPVSNAAIGFGNVSGIESDRGTYPLGDLAVGETANFSFPVSVTGGAAGPQQLAYTITYGATDNRQATTDLLSDVDVAPREPLLTAGAENATVTVQETAVIDLSITNHGTETLRNVQAVPNGSGSLGVTPTSLFVSRLASGETVTRQLEVDADDIEIPGRVPLAIDFQYETSGGESRQVQASPIGIDVVEAESGFITGPIVVGAVLVIVLLGGLIWYFR